MRNIFLLLVAAGISYSSSAQQDFSISLVPSQITSAPKIHSFAFAQHDGKWLFLGGRKNGLHGFLPPFAFPSSGINDSVFVVDPYLNQYWASSLNVLNDSIREQLSSSNMEYFQQDTVLYVTGGYGWKNTISNFITFPFLTAVDVPQVINAVVNNSTLTPFFRQIRDTLMAVAGGHLEKIDSVFYLTFGHRFDGYYNVNDTITGFFVQKYTNEVRKFQIQDDGVSLSIYNYHAIQDTVNFHRRDYNLVPQIFPDGVFGQTAFSGVFRYHINLPFLNSVDIRSDTVTVNNSFNQLLSNYDCASLPMYDSAQNFMHTIFFGGMSLYYLDTITQMNVLDSLVPFVNTISMVSRSSSGLLTEFNLPVRMPALLGTDALFIPDTSILLLHKKIISLDALDSIRRIGFIVGGIQSPDKNISTTDPSLSFANPIVYEVIIDMHDTADASPVLTENNIEDFIVYPNPAKEKVYIDFKLKKEGAVRIELFDENGRKIQTSEIKNYAPGILNHTEINTKSFSAGNYFIRLQFGKNGLTQKLILRGKIIDN